MEFDIQINEDSLAEIRDAAHRLSAVSRVTMDSEARAADAYVKQGKTLVKVVHDQRMAITRRIDAAKKSVMAHENEICAGLNAEIERVSGLCTKYLTDKQRAHEAAFQAERDRITQEQAQAEAEARAEAALTGADVAVPSVADVPTAPSKVVDGVSMRTAWTFTVVDQNAVPRAYCVPDNALIRAYMTEAKKNGAKIEELDIPGVKFTKEIRI